MAESAASTALSDFEATTNPVAPSTTAAGNRGRRTGNPRQNYRAMSNPASRPTAQSQTQSALADALDNAKKDKTEKESAHQAALAALSNFKRGKLITQDDFMEYGKGIVKPIFDDYSRLFLRQGGDYKELTRAYSAARVLNPLVAASMSVLDMEMAIKELKAFGFDEFRDTNGILDKMIEELPTYIAKVKDTTNLFWNMVEGAHEYDKKLAEKAAKDPEKYNGITWKDDPIEKARRVWEWWRAKRCDALHHFTWAARLVVLVQLSSASCERVFSQVKLIIETCGVNPLEETLETRLMERCNEYSIIN